MNSVSIIHIICDSEQYHHTEYRYVQSELLVYIFRITCAKDQTCVWNKKPQYHKCLDITDSVGARAGAETVQAKPRGSINGSQYQYLRFISVFVWNYFLGISNVAIFKVQIQLKAQKDNVAAIAGNLQLVPKAKLHIHHRAKSKASVFHHPAYDNFS